MKPCVSGAISFINIGRANESLLVGVAMPRTKTLELCCWGRRLSMESRGYTHSHAAYIDSCQSVEGICASPRVGGIWEQMAMPCLPIL